MKKILLGTSALVLAGAYATPSSAAEWEMKVGGYMEQFLAYSDTDTNEDLANDSGSDGDFNGVDIKSDAEIHFSPSITLDNGIKISARIELEAAKLSDPVDENYLTFSGSFGTLRLGEDDPVSYNMSYAAPDVTFININSGTDSLYWGGDLLTTFTTTYPEVAGDAQGIMYYSPRMAGFQLGASYARDGNNATSQGQVDLDDDDTKLGDIWAVGANYVNSFGDIDIVVSGGYNAADYNGSTSDDIEHWAAAVILGFSGFSVGASYFEANDDRAANIETYDVGVSYATGPWGVSFTYLNFEQDDLEVDKYMLGMDYKLATGVRLGAFAIYAEAEDSSDDADGFIIGTGVKINF